jgi:D-aminoacyl-tRNA deacylase
MVLCGITHTDTRLDMEYLANKLLKLKLWPDATGQAWSTNLVDNSFDILLVSQFTLYHQLKGTKPDFHDAMPGETALPLFNEFLGYLRKQYRADKVQPGAFGEYMNVEIVGDGPVTLVIDSVKDPKAVAKLEKQQARERANLENKEAKK